jgi:carbon-monoxide dehydrogenase medium subunit
VEQLVTGTDLNPEVLAAAADATSASVEPTGDIHASADYRRRLTATLLRRTLAAAKEEHHG